MDRKREEAMLGILGTLMLTPTHGCPAAHLKFSCDCPARTSRLSDGCAARWSTSEARIGPSGGHVAPDAWVIVLQARVCESWLALFPSRGVKKPRRSFGYACVFCLASRKNSGVNFSQTLTWRTIRLTGVAPIAIGVAPLREKTDVVSRLWSASACDRAYRKYHATPQLR